MDEYVCNRLGLKCGNPDMSKWKEMVERFKNPKGTVKIAVVGKYVGLQDAYKSIYESLRHGGVDKHYKVEIKRIDSELIEKEGPDRLLSDVHGILIPGGFGTRGIEGKINAIKYARGKQNPVFGICLGCRRWPSSSPATFADLRMRTQPSLTLRRRTRLSVY